MGYVKYREDDIKITDDRKYMKELPLRERKKKLVRYFECSVCHKGFTTSDELFHHQSSEHHTAQPILVVNGKIPSGHCVIHYLNHAYIKLYGYDGPVIVNGRPLEERACTDGKVDITSTLNKAFSESETCNISIASSSVILELAPITVKGNQIISSVVGQWEHDIERGMSLTPYNRDQFVDGTCDFLNGMYNYYFELSRADFEELISGALNAASNCVDDALRQAGIQDIDLSYVLLTGGSCYIPAVRDLMVEKFGHRVENVMDPDLAIAQGAAVISELNWQPFLTKDTLIALSDGSYYPMIQAGSSVPELINRTGKEPIREEFICVDQRKKEAKIIICEGKGQHKDKTLEIFTVQTLGDQRFGDDIEIDARLDRDIILTIRGRSKMVSGYGYNENSSIRKSVKIHKLCFGLDFSGGTTHE